MTVRIHADNVRLLLILPNCIIPLCLRIASAFTDEREKKMLLTLADVFRNARRWRGLELVNITDADGTEVLIKM